MIVVNGRNIWPQDVERAVKAVSELQNAHAAAFAVDEDNSEVVVVF
ncbi:hypothetical protein HED48_05760 [Ochrobactrum intermedium]|nr:hypothetical protein [Brucella intermedia]